LHPRIPISAEELLVVLLNSKLVIRVVRPATRLISMRSIPLGTAEVMTVEQDVGRPLVSSAQAFFPCRVMPFDIVSLLFHVHDPSGTMMVPPAGAESIADWTSASEQDAAVTSFPDTLGGFVGGFTGGLVGGLVGGFVGGLAGGFAGGSGGGSETTPPPRA
jgi:hypothetical protein